MAAGSVTISRIFIRPPHFEQTVTSTAKTRARRCAQPMRRGVAVASDGHPMYTKPHVKFDMDPAQVRSMFMATSLWGDADVAYRELYQNALEACRRRKAESARVNQPYTPEISFSTNDSEHGGICVECADNGVGMNRSDFVALFATTGPGYSRSEQASADKKAWEEHGTSFTCTGRFGIGVLSYFMIASAIEVQTLRSGSTASKALSISIPSAGEHFIVREDILLDSRVRQGGTIVRLHLREDVDPKSCIKAIQNYVWRSDVKVDVSHFLDREELHMNPGELLPSLEKDLCVKSGDVWWLFPNEGGGSRPGKILVDGVCTNEATPGLIIEGLQDFVWAG